MAVVTTEIRVACSLQIRIDMTYKVMTTGASGPSAISFMRAIQAEDMQQFAVDTDVMAAGLFLVPAQRRYLLTPPNQKTFVDELLNLCSRLEVDVLVPTRDLELIPIARRMTEFLDERIDVMCESVSTLRLCLDRFALYERLNGYVPMLDTRCINPRFRVGGLGPNFVVKPRCGRTEGRMHMVDNDEQLLAVPHDSSYVAQPYLPGEDYSVDVVCTDDGYIAVPRLRLKVESGLALVSQTVTAPDLVELSITAADRVGIQHVANLHFRRDRDGQPYLLKINPRIPGTMPLTVAAGVNMPNIALRRILDLPVQLNSDYRELAVVRSLRETFVNPNALRPADQWA